MPICPVRGYVIQGQQLKPYLENVKAHLTLWVYIHKIILRYTIPCIRITVLWSTSIWRLTILDSSGVAYLQLNKKKLLVLCRLHLQIQILSITKL